MNDKSIIKDNMIMATFKNEKDAREIYSILKESTKRSTTEFQVLQVVLIKKDDGHIHVLDQKSDVFTEIGKTMIGGFVGAVLGVLIGPFAGFVLAGVGAIIGSGFDISDQTESESMLYEMYSRIHDGDIVILAIVEERDELVFNSVVGKKAIDIYRWDAAEIREEAEYADNMQKGILKHVVNKFTEAKDEKRREKVSKYKNDIKEEFEKSKKDR